MDKEIKEKKIENETLKEVVNPESELKKMFIQYVGEKLKPESGEVTVEMIVEVLSEEFPEFLMVVAEENWVRGYEQGLVDVEVGLKMKEEEEKEEEKDD